MAQTNNPFHKWLGFGPTVSNPHHFQLLRVSPKLTDQVEIETAVAAGVERNLGLLAKVPPGKYDPLVANVKSRIATAEKILLDPKLRAQYKLKLKAQMVAAKTTHSAGDASASKKSSRNNSGSKGPSVTQHASETDLSPPIQEPSQPNTTHDAGGPAVSSARPADKPVAAPMAMPAAKAAPLKAVPWAVPISSLGSVPVAKATGLQGIAEQPPALRERTLNDGGDPPVGPVVDKVTKRKPRLAGSILTWLMLGTGLGGAFLIYQNFDKPVKLGRNDQSGDNSNTQKLVVSKKADEVTPLKKVDIESKTDLRVESIKEYPDTNVMTGRTSEEEKNLASQTSRTFKDPVVDILGVTPDANQDTPENPDDETINSEMGKDNPDPSSLVGQPTDVTNNENEEPEIIEVSLNELQLTRVRRNMERAYRAIYRREEQVAKHCVASANAVLDEAVKSDGHQLVPEQRVISQRIGDYETLISNIEEFWDQVRQSADSIAGAQEIVIGTQIVGFVESKPNSVIVRRSGANVEYDYTFCPPGLAVAIAEMGTIDDIPTWNLQKAAFYSIDQLGGLDHSRRIGQFLAIAEDAGHACEMFRRMGNLSLNGHGRPMKKIARPSSDSSLFKIGSSSIVEQFRKEQGYKSPRSVDRQEAYDLADRLLNTDSADLNQRVRLLEEARQLAISAGAASLAQDVVYELVVSAELDWAEVACDTYVGICKQKLEVAQARQLLERGIGYLNSGLAETAKPKSKADLKGRLLKLAALNRMVDAYRRLEQIKL